MLELVAMRRMYNSSAKKLKTVEREAVYVVVASLGGIFWLHRAGSYGCWMGRKRGDGEEPWYDATWEWGDHHGDGAGDPHIPR